MKHLGKTSAFRGARGEPMPGSIAEAAYVRIGGVDQWVLMRGESLANPVVIVLHGGPGFSDMQFFRRSCAELEKSFTVVHWDQRGTGKSYDRTIPRSSMTLEQMLSDLGELIEVVRSRTGKERVTLFGHSWGSLLGPMHAARAPETIAAYVGCAQIGDWPAAEAKSYAYGVAEAERRHDEKALAALRGIGPPPYGADEVFTERMTVQRLDGEMGVKAAWTLGRMLLGGPEASVADLPNMLRGFRFSMRALWGEVSKVNLLEAVPRLTMPTFFFLGRRDHWVPLETSLAYVDALVAPSKEVVIFDHSGHEPFVDEPKKFLAAMEHIVRPVVAGEAGVSRMSA